MNDTANIIYAGFYDVPVAFVVTHKETQYLFLRDFDEAIDDYPNSYTVYRLPNIAETEIKKIWKDIEKKATAYLGEVPVKEVKFDESKRKSIGTDVLLRFEKRKT